MKKLNIGIITHNFPSSETDRQNAGIFALDLAKALSRKAHVSVLAPGNETQIKEIFGIKTYFFKYPHKLGMLKTYNPKDLLKLVEFFVKGVKASDHFINSEVKLDFLISMWAFPSGVFANKISKTIKVPYAVYCLGSDIYIYAKKPILKNLISKYIKEAKFSLADSPDLAETVEKLTGTQTLFLPSASDFILSKKSKLKQDKIVVTFLGRLEPVKGFDVFLDSLLSLDQEIKKFIINIIGDGSLRDEVRKIKYSGLKYWGNINESKKISSIIAGSDWLVIPSRSDSIPLVFSESMKQRVPVITSDLPDLKYLVEKYKVGLTFKNSSPRHLKKILESISKNPNLQKISSKNTKKAASIFDLKKTSDTLLKLIRENI